MQSANYANLLHISVFPVPGGPYNNTFYTGVIPKRLNSYGLVKGSNNVLYIVCNVSPKPPIPNSIGFIYIAAFIKF